MIDILAAPEATAFLAALGVMLFIALAEGVGLLFGVALSGMIDALLPDIDVPDIEIDGLDMDGADLDAPDLDSGTSVHAPDLDAPSAPSGGVFTQVLGWLCFGRVPALVLLVIFLTVFGLTGLAVLGVATAMTGFTPPGWIAALPALAAGFPATRYAALGFARIMPKEQTEAVSRDSFIGKVAVVTRGVARTGLPSEAKLKDVHGQTHYVLVEPDIEGESFAAGEEVLVVRQAGAATYRVIANDNPALQGR